MSARESVRSSKGMVAMRMYNSAVKRYLREVRKSLPCGRKERKRVLDGIRQSIENEPADGPETYEDLVSRYGSPDEIASSYFSEKSTGELIRELRIGNRVLAILLSAVVIALLLRLGWWVASYVSLMGEYPGYIVEGQPVVIEDYEIDSEGDIIK